MYLAKTLPTVHQSMEYAMFLCAHVDRCICALELYPKNGFPLVFRSQFKIHEIISGRGTG